MSEMNELINDINKLRKNLEALISEKDGDLLDPDVLAASKMLNAVINEYNKIVKEKIRKSHRDEEI
ncbi:Spo0E family sporulation regulatory protein-aspartic acid phosphatase [Clostridium bovifaecis]|uniref:Spo0E family sporulation regulatory protein-aspartic acid phosphatase n=1 Tax=Clostridium bovifaecis TaxID=2184719 RepID=A0A6I6ERJ9_9CLOT|nr:Spo0E family sporulation regulatory protein-aspartic acid phosphatase [Clostridium bovifaecis]